MQMITIPLLVLLLKCTLEYPQKFALRKDRTSENFRLCFKMNRNQLLNDIKKWSEWIFDEAKKEIRKFYPLDEMVQNQLVISGLELVPCQNPSCERKFR